MTSSRGATRIVAAALAIAAAACGGGTKEANAPSAASPRDETRRLEGRPPVAVIAREGDPRSAVAMAISTAGIAPERGAEPAVALAALLEGRATASAGIAWSVTPAADGVRVRALAATDAEAAAIADALRAAALAPVTDGEMTAVRRKLAALARRPLADPALEAAAACAGEAAGAPGTRGEAAPVDAQALEGWRRAAARLGRVALATAGSSAAGDAVAAALGKGPAWPAAETIAPEPPFPTDAKVYDATGGLPSGGGRATLAVRVPAAERAVHAAEALGDPQGALAARLGGLDAPARLRDVTATAHARGGCLVVTLDFAPRDLAIDAAARIATAVALTKQEIASELADGAADAVGPRLLARRAGDPRAAAETAAWWALSARDEAAAGEPRVALAVGLALGRDALPGRSPEEATTIAARATAIRAELDRAVSAWHEPVVEARTRVEPGQGELWIAVGSPCGTAPERGSDAGLGAAFALAAADRATAALRGTFGRAEGWAAADGLGVVVHGPALPGEPPEAHARRLADAAARSFAAEPLDPGAISRARARLLDAGDEADARALVALGEALAPGHPSWIAPMGPIEALGRSSDAAVLARASAVRSGPLRVAVLADVDDAQAQAAVRAVDRWVARRPGESRACPAASAPPPPRPATYAVEVPSGRASQAWLAAPLPVGDPSARASAEWLAAALDGPDGLLARALAAGGLARSWSARVVGGPLASALVVRIDSAPGALDAAVAQARVLFDRVRQGSLVDADRARAAALLADRDLSSSLDPARRVAALWRPSSPAPPPSLDMLRAFAAAALRDDALVIVAVRPPRPKAT